ncbi:MAG: hypothetical protein ABSF82_00710 [Candidatus Bathyarchaeia archaeon]
MPSVLANLASGAAATFVPLFVGLFLPFAIAKDASSRFRILMAVSSGIIFWFFLDVMNDAVLLDINQGFAGGIAQGLLVVLFTTSLLLLFGLERLLPKSSIHATSRENNETLTGISFGVAILVALGMGFHAMGEGIEIGSLMSTAPDMIQAIGGLLPGIAYVFHKVLEGFVIGVFAAVTKSRAHRVVILGALGGIPTVLGSLIALVTPVNSTFFFALGGAAAIYIEYKLIPNFVRQRENLPYVVASLAGFYLMYLAGLFHG